MKQVRSLDRGLDLMEVLAREGAQTLAQLHAATGLPKSTIRRLLATLQARRIVRQTVSDGRYRINIAMPSVLGDPLPPLAAAAIDLVVAAATDLTRDVGWPSDIHVPEGVAMRIVDSTRPLSPFHMFTVEANRRVSIFGSAAGLCYLSTLPPAAVAALEARTRDYLRWSLARFRMTPADLEAELAATRARGYGRRLPGYVGESPRSDELFAIAVPVRQGDRVWGIMTLAWPRAHLPVEDFAARFLAPLQAAAGRASTQLDDLL